MPTFLTVREAALRTGKSPTSIRRILYPILQDDHHADRPEIQPGVEEALQRRMKGDNFAWRLSEDLLRRSVRVDPPSQQGSPGSSSKAFAGHGDAALLDMLRRELDIKNQQIARNDETVKSLNETIISLSERLRETNILIGGLQQRLGLTDGRDAKPLESLAPKNVTPTKRQGSAPSPKPAKPDKAPAAAPKPAKPKKGFFWRLFP